MKTSRVLPIHGFPETETPAPFAIVALGEPGSKTQDDLPHRHEFYAIQYVTGGKGQHVIDFSPYALSSDTLYFISPGQVHFGRFTQPLQGFVLVFMEEFLLYPGSFSENIYELSFFHTVGEKPVLHLNPQDAARIRSYMSAIEEEYQAGAPDRIPVLRAHLYILMVNIQRLYSAQYPGQNSAKGASFVRKFKHLVSTHCTQQMTLETCAAALNVSMGHLSNTIKALTGQSPGQIIRREIALEAKRLLAHTDLTAAEVGYRLNFEDPSYFGRFFKKATGLSPTAFREQIRSKYRNILSTE
ncbi:MAG: helix-turn-helix domain-containing protein [Deltaproteobacteria bacterium]|nr:helix-turn-helix domain-containing protein [Deltaproteobacteria bacterium]